MAGADSSMDAKASIFRRPMLAKPAASGGSSLQKSKKSKEELAR